MNTEWIIRGAIAIAAHALGARGKDVAREKASWEGMQVGIQLGAEATKQEVQRRMNNESSFTDYRD